MGNGQAIEADLLVADSSRFVHMLNKCNITLNFLDHALLQWVELGRPLQLKTSFFKDKLLTEKYQQDIQLNY